MKALGFSEVFMRHRRAFAFLIVLGLLPLAVAACHDATASNDPRTQPPLVRVATVETSVHAERSFTGIVAARVQSDLGFRVPGKVLERLVDAGQTVKRGQPLMRIDPTDLRLATRARATKLLPPPPRAHARPQRMRRDTATSFPLARCRRLPTTK
jgi:multidrug efflux pump subunit AcrA (membrane-fusion protein)